MRRATSAAATAISGADPDRVDRQLHVLDEPRPERVVPVVGDPVGAERPVLADAFGAAPEVRDDRSVAVLHQVASASSRPIRSTEIDPTRPSYSTRVRTAPSDSISESASRRVVLPSSASASAGASSAGSSSISLRRKREALEPAVHAHEPRDELVGGMGEDLVRRVVLREHAALAEDRDPVAELDRLVDVVRHEDDGLAHLGLEAEELVLEPVARDRIEGAEGLVHQHHRRIGGEGARQPDAGAGRPRAARDSGR